LQIGIEHRAGSIEKKVSGQGSAAQGSLLKIYHRGTEYTEDVVFPCPGDDGQGKEPSPSAKAL
jgi:hypothetical protein